jgi:hypothetical protein
LIADWTLWLLPEPDKLPDALHKEPKAAPLIGPLIPSMPPIVIGAARRRGASLQFRYRSRGQITRRGPVAAMPAPDAVRSATFSAATLASNPLAASAPRQADATPLPKPRPRKTARVKGKKRR